jgi:hypothetical protein
MEPYFFVRFCILAWMLSAPAEGVVGAIRMEAGTNWGKRANPRQRKSPSLVGDYVHDRVSVYVGQSLTI